MPEVPPRRRAAPTAARRKSSLRVGLILGLMWLLVIALWPMIYPFYVHGRAQMRVDAIQAVVGLPDQPAQIYPATLEELKALCLARGVPWVEDTRRWQFTYDPSRGLVGYEIASEDLRIRQYMAVVVYQRVQEVLVALVLLVVAAGLGQRVLRLIRAHGLPLAERLLFGTALGLGGMALATLGLGLAGWLAFTPFVVMLAATGLVGAGPLVDDVRELYRSWRATTTHMGLWAGLMAAAGILFVVLPLLGAFGPPFDYDALEYHLGAPAEYYLDGRITRLEGNCYSNFPFNVEMLYLMSMVLRRGVIAGTYLARVINVLLGVLCALSIWAFGRRFLKEEGTRAGGVGCLLFLSSPWFFWILTTVNVYVELGLALFSLLAVYATMLYLYGDRAVAAPPPRAARAPKPASQGEGAPGPEGPHPGSGVPQGADGGAGRRSLLVLAGLLAGLAMGTKYPAAAFVAVPLVVWVAAVEARRRRAALAARLGRVVLFGAVALATVAPWLVKNAVLTGNPTYPLLSSVFGGVDWSPEQDARWTHAHRGGYGLGIFDRLGYFFLTDQRIVILTVLFLPFALCARSSRPLVWRLFAYLAYVFAAWFFLTNQIERFLFPAYVLMTALAGWGYVWVDRSPVRWLGRAALVGYLAYLAVFAMAAYGKAEDRIFEQRGRSPLETLDESIRARDRDFRGESPIEALLYLQEARRRQEIRIGPDARLLLVGEAQTFYLSAYGQRDFIRSTVFDRNPLLEKMREAGADRESAGREAYEHLVRLLRDDGIRYLLVNFAAIRRFRRSYAFPFHGQTVPGYPLAIDEPLFDRLTGMGLLRLLRRYRVDTRRNEDPLVPTAYAIYEVVEPRPPR